MLCNIPIHTLAAGNKQLLQRSRNTAGSHAASLAHLRCNLRLKEGKRHFLLGRNGCGKTTLLRAIASGELEGWPEGVSMHLVDQDCPVDAELTPLEAVLAADTQLETLEKEASKLEEYCASCVDQSSNEAALERLCQIYEIIGDEDEGQRRRRAVSILKGLGFEQKMLGLSVGSLSGGWQMRTSLAAALFMGPTLLLLDEPTNHLDLDAVRWLQHHLAHEYLGTVLCVSHNRAFINAVATDVIIFTESQSLEYFSGTLEDFEKQAAKAAKELQRKEAAAQKKRDHIVESVKGMEEASERRERNQSANKASNKFGPLQNGSKSSSQVAQRKKKLALAVVDNDDDDLIDHQVVLLPQREDPTLKFAFADAEPLSLPEDIPMLELRSVGFTYPGTDEAIFADLDLSVSERCRIAVAGKNGAGKSTLVKLLTGNLHPVDGEVFKNQHLRIAYFGQHDAEMLQRHDATALEYMHELFPKMRDPEVVRQLNMFGVIGDMVVQPMAMLSGGQRMRVAFARMCAEEPHLLVLDEPTNHLDIFSISALADALKTFQGGVIIATHDENLIEEVADEVVIVSDKCIRSEKASLLNKKRFNL